MAEFADLLQSQIKEHCRLSLPEGLKELMSDISREVLRAQPKDIYGFITKYLVALLVSRENLSIASRVCQDVCASMCHPELESLLRDFGLDEENATEAKEIIDKYFEDGGADEQTLMYHLIPKTEISETQLLPLRYAIQEAFLEHQLNKAHDDTVRKMPSDDDEISNAAINTLQLYAKTGPSEEEYNQKASRIQTAYRAYGVRRFCPSKSGEVKRDRRNIQFVAEVEETEAESTESFESSYNYDSQSLYDEKEVSAIHFIDPKNFIAKGSKTILKFKISDLSNTKDTSVVPKVIFIEPRVYEISKHTIDDDCSIVEEEKDKSSDIKLSRNSHNILEDVAKRRGYIGGSDVEDQYVSSGDETDCERSHSISSNIDVVSSTLDTVNDFDFDTAEHSQESA